MNMPNSYTTQYFRTGVVVAAFLVAIPLGAFLGAVTVSSFTGNFVIGGLRADWFSDDHSSDGIRLVHRCRRENSHISRAVYGYLTA